MGKQGENKVSTKNFMSLSQSSGLAATYLFSQWCGECLTNMAGKGAKKEEEKEQSQSEIERAY